METLIALAVFIGLCFVVYLVMKVTDIAVDGAIEGIFAVTKRIFSGSDSGASRSLSDAPADDFDPHGLVTAPIKFTLDVPVETASQAFSAGIERVFPAGGSAVVTMTHRERVDGRETLRYVGGTAEQPDSFVSELWLDDHHPGTDVTYLVQEFTKLGGTLAAADVLRMLRNEVESVSYRLDSTRTIIIGKANF